MKIEFAKDDVSLDVIKNHNFLKYAMAVAVSGRHHLITWGSAGCGKTMTLQKITQLLPLLNDEEMKEVKAIYEEHGLNKVKNVRPFRMPHLSATIAGMCGGGIDCQCGEITLAHNGVLFLDEASEFRTSVLQMLRVPMGTNNVKLSRCGEVKVYPAKFQLIMANNPCPCGNFGTENKICLCSAKSVELYWKKLSEPLLDRIAIRVIGEEEDDSFSFFKLTDLQMMIATAWDRQYKRQGCLNEDLDFENLAKLLDKRELEELAKFNIINEQSVKGYSNIAKLSKTIADMQGKTRFDVDDVTLALRLHHSTPLEQLYGYEEQ